MHTTLPVSRGSSPLTRGKPVRASRCLARLGLIPAHAGKTGVARYEDICGAAHPRSRGENPLGFLRSTRSAGSSPLTRGKHRHHRRLRRQPRLIPAHAGKTCPALSTGSARRAHPRSRGENVAGIYLSYRRRGSSPLTRGKPEEAAQPIRSHGLIPAHAGKTFNAGRFALICQAHPRSHGENTTASSATFSAQGSSPLTRGKRLRKEAPRER